MNRERIGAGVPAILFFLGMIAPLAAQQDKPFLSGTLPREVVEAVNAYPRTYQHGGADAGHEFFFNGNTVQLNAFLAALTAVKDASFRVTLFTEPGRGLTLEDQKPFTYRWSMRVAEALPLAGVELTPTKRPEGGPTWEISVAVSVAEGIELGRLELPLAYQATIGGRLGNFVLWHNDRRQWREEEGGKADKPKPTSETLIRQLVNSLGRIEAGAPQSPAAGESKSPAAPGPDASKPESRPETKPEKSPDAKPVPARPEE